MKNKNLALVAVLFTISVIMAFANGPAPLVTIDTDQIVDGAVTAIKTDGSLMLSDGSNAVDPVELKNASFTGDIDVTGDVGAATVNGVAPLTAAEKTQALVGSPTVSVTHLSTAIGTVNANYITLSQSFTIATDATYAVTGYTLGTVDSGEIRVHSRTDGKVAKFEYNYTAVAETYDPDSFFSATKDNAGTVNVYIEGGAIIVQNKVVAADKALKIFIGGFDN